MPGDRAQDTLHQAFKSGDEASKGRQTPEKYYDLKQPPRLLTDSCSGVSFVDSVEKQTEGRFTSETAAGESDSETDEELGTGVSPKCVFPGVHRLASKGIQEAVSKPTFGCQKKGIPSS